MLAQAAETITPNETDTQIARRSSEALAELLERGAGKTPIHFRTEDSQEADIMLPLSAVRLLHHALQEMAKGNAITLPPMEPEPKPLSEIRTRQEALEELTREQERLGLYE